MKQELTVVVGVDLSTPGDRALAMGLRLVRGFGRGEVHIAHALTQHDLAELGTEIQRQDQALSHLPQAIWRKVDRVMQKVGVDPVDMPVWQHVRIGAPADVVRQVAVDYDADLVVVGSHGRKGVQRLMVGSVAEALVRDARFPVLVAHENLLGTMEKTALPDPPPAPGELLAASRPEGAHLYRSTLVDAWRGMGRPTSPDFR